MKNKTRSRLAHITTLTGIVAIFSLSSAIAQPGGVRSGLRVWLTASSGIGAADGESVAAWGDLSGNNNHAYFNPFNVYGEAAPIFDAANPGISDAPSVRFNGQNALELDLSWLAGSDYTIFVVNARDRLGLANFYIAGDSALQHQDLVLGYEQPQLLRLSHFNNDLDAVVEAYNGTPVWTVDSFVFDQSVGREIRHDGLLVASDASVTPLLSNTGTTLGHYRAFGALYWFTGDLAEVVVYDRALSSDERLRVESELAARAALNYDVDGDGVADADDNCATVPNADQLDANGDGYGDACVHTRARIAKAAIVGPGLTAKSRATVLKKAKLGRWVTLGSYAHIIGPVSVGSYVTIGDRTNILPGALIGSNTNIGNQVVVGVNVDIGEDVTIGDSVLVSPFVRIGDGATIGNRVLILPGAVIEPGEVIPDGSVVFRNR